MLRTYITCLNIKINIVWYVWYMIRIYLALVCPYFCMGRWRDPQNLLLLKVFLALKSCKDFKTTLTFLYNSLPLDLLDLSCSLQICRRSANWRDCTIHQEMTFAGHQINVRSFSARVSLVENPRHFCIYKKENYVYI